MGADDGDAENLVAPWLGQYLDPAVIFRIGDGAVEIVYIATSPPKAINLPYSTSVIGTLNSFPYMKKLITYIYFNYRIINK